MARTSCVAYDLTRLFFGPVHITPRGIDRVELGYAKHFLKEWPGLSVATLPTPAGVRVISRDAAIRVIESAERSWGENNDPDRDPMLARLKQRLHARCANGKAISRRTRTAHWLAAAAHMLRRAGCAFGPLAAEALPANAVYLNVGQVGIAVPQFLAWLKRRPDIKPVFMLHDLIPLECPDFVPASSSYFHGQMVSNVATYASGVIATSRTAGAAICRDMQRRGRADIPIITEPLPVAPAFTDGPSVDPELAEVPYFVIVGSIEPRKNHLLLLNVWRDLVRLEQPSAPKLVIAGTRWNGHEPVTAMLGRSERLRNHVVEIGGLSTPSLRRILSNARGLLMPSFAEGFGLPIIEAAALGVPVIASDIPAHCEAGGDGATYIDPTDGPGWLAAIRDLMRQGRKQNGAQPAGLLTWPEYLGRIDPFLEAIGSRQRSVVLGGALAPAAATAV